ncbi:hypothetical protein CEXT_755301 [Caerostris extrusa]|uniref:Uncharacterized protein n=1 Tax=Caerostris extrusa TaxID=172846 RepID=A0AAV4P6I1_CAEEX|nr:hypothetical protein CEXT_755301 [Caerostris extrusa]
MRLGETPTDESQMKKEQNGIVRGEKTGEEEEWGWWGFPIRKGSGAVLYVRRCEKLRLISAEKRIFLDAGGARRDAAAAAERGGEPAAERGLYREIRSHDRIAWGSVFVM